MFEACRKLGPAFASLAIAASVAACAAPSGVTDLGAFECKQISQRAEAKINWARVPEREIVIRNDAFSPMVMRLMQGRPYVIRVRNRDDQMHVMRAGAFFQNNAVVAVGVEGKRADETCITAISIPARQSAEIRLVAITDGTYDYGDETFLPAFYTAGNANGVIIVEERRETASY